MKTSTLLILAACLTNAAGAQARQQAGTISGTVSVPGGRVSDAVVYLVSERNHDVALQGKRHPLIDQVNLRFSPSVIVVLPGTAVEFRNSDPVFHNVFSPGGSGERFDLGRYPRNDSRSHTFKAHGAHVILCHIHPEMVAYVVVAPTPYFAIVDGTGRFRIDDVPPGRYTIRVWQRRVRPFEEELVVREGEHLHLNLVLTR